MIIMGALSMANAVQIGSDVTNRMIHSTNMENKLAQITVEKFKKNDAGDVDWVWLCIVVLAIIVLGLVIWLVIWYNCCREDEEEEKKEDKMEDKKDEMMMGDGMMMEAPPADAM